jgi:hypothetical protein
MNNGRNNGPKIKGVFTDATPICEALKQSTQKSDLDQSFMYTQIMKEILLTINFEQKHFMEFIFQHRTQSIGDFREMLLWCNVCSNSWSRREMY